MDTWRTLVLTEATSWLRTPWHHNARVKGAGVDCGQFLVASYVNPGVVPDFDVGPYTSDWMMHQQEERFREWVRSRMDQIEAPQPADVTLWRFGKCFSHAAVVVDWPLVIHASRSERGVCYGDATKGMLAHERLPEGGSTPRPVEFYSIAGRL